MQFASLMFALSLLFLHETQRHCPFRCRDYELNKEFLRLQFYFDFQRDIFDFFDRKIFEPLFMLNHILSRETHGLIILVSIITTSCR